MHRALCPGMDQEPVKSFIFKDHFLHAPERSIPTYRKSNKGNRRLEWVSKLLLTESSHKKEVCKRWNQRQGTQEEHRSCGDMVRKAKAVKCKTAF